MDFDDEDLGLIPDTVRPKTSGKERDGFGLNRPGTSASSISRPMSRHGSAVMGGNQRPFSRQGSAINGRMSSARPTSGRMGTAMGHRPGPVPGTASRLTATASQNRPLTSSRGSVLGIQAPVPQVADRPITQQGLTGIRTAAGGTSAGGSQRYVQDKSYFVGILRAKMAELSTEINHIQSEVMAAQDEQSTYLAYEKRVKEAAAELTEQQAKLADYNLLVDKLNTDTEVGSVEREAAELALQNDSESREVDELFAEKQTRLRQIEVLENEVDQVGNMADNLVSAMQPSLRERYIYLKNQNLQYQDDLEKMNQELDLLSSRKAALDDEVAVSQVKKEALSLYDNLREIEKKRDDLINEEKNRGTPAQERERLLNQVKEDNAEISTMEQQIAEIQDSMNRIQEEQSQLDQDLEENQSEKNQKYRDLKKREETMDSFLSSFESNKVQELERCAELQSQIEDLTSKMSRHLSSVAGQALPNRTDFAAMKEDLAFREDEIEKSKTTLEGLTVQHNQLNINLEKIEALEGKIKSEMVTIKEKMGTMEEELQVFSDLERLRIDAAEKRELLEQEHLSLSSRKMVAVQNADQVKSTFQSLTKQLAESETAVQLNNLEKKWSHLEQNNFAIEEFVANKKAEMNFELIKNKVLKMQWAYNRMLIENVKNLTTAPSTAY